MTTILLVLLGVILILGTALSLWLASYVMTGKRQTLAEAFAWQSDHYDTSFYGTLEKTAYTVEGFDGYTLHAELLKTPQATSKYILISHGYTDNRMGSLKYAKMYLSLGFNCIAYDLRGHGENAPAPTTYGLREGQDLKRLIEDTRKRYPEMTLLGLHGESLGAATTLTALQYKPQVDFVVADCGFSDIENVLRGGYRNAHLPEWLFYVADIGARLRYGVSLQAMRPIDALAENVIPILFIHGAEDTFILPQNALDMAARTKGTQETWLVPHAGHAASILTAPADYAAHVQSFLQALEAGKE